MEDHGLAGKLRGVLLGEGDVDVLLLTGLHAGHLLLKAGDKAVGTQHQAVVLTLAAVEGHAVLEALEVDDGGVAVLGLAVHADKAAVAVRQLLQALVHILVGDGHHGAGSGEALVLAQGHLGIEGHHGGEGIAVLGDLVFQVDLGIAHKVQVLLLHSLHEGGSPGGLHGILIEDALAVSVLDHLAGGLAGTEAREADLLALLQISLLHSGFKLGSFHLNGQLGLALF